MFDSQTHFHALYQNASPEFAFRGSTPADVSAWQQAFRPRLRQALGLARIEDCLRGYQPTAQPVDEEDLGDFVRQRWTLTVEPTVALPFIVLRPKKAAGPLPLVLTPHGHGKNTELYAGVVENEDDRKSMVEGERDIAVQAVREGYIAVCPTARGFGDTRTPEDKAAGKTSSCRTQLLHDLLVGRTPIGDRVWDIARLIDWAFDSLPVDRRRVAITGNSGGGTVSLFAAACDERITVAAPSCYFCTFAGSIGSIYHCDCNYVPGMLTLGEMWDVAGLIAPRPFVAVAGRDDPIFPLPEVRRAFERLQVIYAAAGAPGGCALYVGEGGHRYYKDGSWPFIRAAFAQAG